MTPSAAVRATSIPARTDPVIEAMRGVVRDHLPAGLAVAAQHVEHAGRQELGRDLGQQQLETGVVSDGLSTTVLPAASAGANFHMAIMIG